MSADSFDSRFYILQMPMSYSTKSECAQEHYPIFCSNMWQSAVNPIVPRDLYISARGNDPVRELTQRRQTEKEDLLQ